MAPWVGVSLITISTYLVVWSPFLFHLLPVLAFYIFPETLVRFQSCDLTRARWEKRKNVIAIFWPPPGVPGASSRLTFPRRASHHLSPRGCCWLSASIPVFLLWPLQAAVREGAACTGLAAIVQRPELVLGLVSTMVNYYLMWELQVAGVCEGIPHSKEALLGRGLQTYSYICWLWCLLRV